MGRAVNETAEDAVERFFLVSTTRPNLGSTQSRASSQSENNTEH